LLFLCYQCFTHQHTYCTCARIRCTCTYHMCIHALDNIHCTHAHTTTHTHIQYTYKVANAYAILSHFWSPLQVCDRVSNMWCDISQPTTLVRQPGSWGQDNSQQNHTLVARGMSLHIIIHHLLPSPIGCQS